MKEYNESGLLFRFGDQWEVYQLDKEADYREKICKLVPETKSIDFIGFNETGNILLFMEVKSFRGYGNRTNRQRLTGESDDITMEVAQKVRDSLATIIGGARHSTNLPDKWKKYIEHLNKGKALKVIAWVELDVSTTNLLRRANVNMNTREKELRKRLKWLTSDVQILNTQNYNKEWEGMEVSQPN
ncbi:hypothetical protein [Bacteroides sp.]|uniref:hypothetical protein n=1 Tax=Bacteroides sp. TaxID=29523 RepID=UPI0023CF5315|nr:hypothetical protein [Bacteroides sp.]MDE5710061.1 hypothetical protein [Bacteroides sp.]MDE6215707.1 hypothetical protein [Bacteroides sp.]